MNVPQLTLLLVGFVGLGLPPQAAGDGEPIAVVVNESSTISDISLVDLQRLYKGRSTKLPDGTPVQLIEHQAVRDRFYRVAVGMSPSQVRRHWITLVFSGGGAVPPKTFADTRRLLRAVSESPSAVAILPVSGVDDTVKLLTVDGRSPTDAAYPLR